MNLQDFLHCIETNEIPLEAPDHLVPGGYGPHFLTDKSIDYYTARAFCTERGMWAIVYKEWVEKLAKWIGNRKVLEIMAGKGWLAKALSECGVNIEATDNEDWNDKHSKQKSLLFPVIKMDAIEAVTKFPEAEILLCSWPPYEDDTIYWVCNAWGETRPIIYIGEDYGGCNAPDRFFEHFKENTVVPRFSLVSWDGIHDRIFIGHYMKEAIRETY